MLLKLLLLLQVSLLLTSVECNDVINAAPGILPCNQDLCRTAQKHIGCVDPWKIAEKCGSGEVKMVIINVPMAIHIVEHVNTMRNLVASGFTKMSAAARMPVMGWSHELAYGADLLGRQCDYEERYCVNSPRYHYVASVELIAPMRAGASASKVVIAELLLVWLNDIMGCRMDSNHQILPISKGKCIGHYMPLIQEYGTRMGCALRLVNNKKKAAEVGLICLFSRTNVIGMPPYEVGRVPAEKCLTGTHILYPHLCSADEPIDSNYIIDSLSSEVDLASIENCNNLRAFLIGHLEYEEW